MNTAGAMDVAVSIRNAGGLELHETRRAKGPLVFGRHPTCSVVLDSDLVSRQHASIEVRVDGLHVVDTSTNGTIVGGRLVRRTAVTVPFGTPIGVGDFIVSLRPQDAAKEETVLRQSPVPSQAPAKPVVAVAPSPPIARASEPTTRPQIAISGALRREIHKLLLEHLDLATMDPGKVDDPSLRPKVLAAARTIVKSLEGKLPKEADADQLVGEIVDEALGLGPLERFLADPAINEIMVIDAETIYVERSGKIVKTDARFTDDDRVRAVVERIVTPLGRRIDESSPLVDARLRDGSRVNAIIRPLALRGSCITIRKFARTPLTLDRIIELGGLTRSMATFLSRSVIARKNIVVSGGTGSGKTTLLNILSAAIPNDERIVTVEDAAELRLSQEHVVSLETRPPNMEGRGEYTIRDLVKNALRMRPDRIVVGEVRGGEALDMLQAMNTGHDGSLTSMHANSPEEATGRLETMVLMAGLDLPVRAIREQIAGSVDIIVQQKRFSDGSRKITAVSEVVGVEESGEIRLVPIFEYSQTGVGPRGRIEGEFLATGYLPTFLQEFIVLGLVRAGEAYL